MCRGSREGGGGGGGGEGEGKQFVSLIFLDDGRN